MSNMSIWLGPPSRLNRMTDLALPCGRRESDKRGAVADCDCCACKKRGSDTPNRDKAPTRIASRRVTPSHSRPAWPRILSIGTSFLPENRESQFYMLFHRPAPGQRINARL